MSKTAVISARIDPDLKRKAEQIFEELGLTTTQAITLFYKQVEFQQGIPFTVRIPNKITLRALEEARDHQNLDRFNSLDELYDDLGIR